MPGDTRFQPFRLQGLGLGPGDLRLEAYHPRWKRLFSDEAHFLYDTLRLEHLRLYHIGSTAIPGLSAKPILDIIGEVHDLELIDQLQTQLESIGYQYLGERGIPQRRFCSLQDATSKSYIHLHLFPSGHPEVQRHILFRDFLRNSDEARRSYELSKIRLVQDEKVTREKYSEAKTEHILELDQQAAEWNRRLRKTCVLAGSAAGGHQTLDFCRQTLKGTAFDIIELTNIRLNPFTYETSKTTDADDFLFLIKSLVAADEIIFATPVYWYAMSGPMKLFFDRLSDLLKGPHQQFAEALAGKKVRVLATGTDDRLPLGFEVPFAATCLYLAMDYLGAQYQCTKTS